MTITSLRRYGQRSYSHCQNDCKHNSHNEHFNDDHLDRNSVTTTIPATVVPHEDIQEPTSHAPLYRLKLRFRGSGLCKRLPRPHAVHGSLGKTGAPYWG